MDLDLSDDQGALRSALRDFLEKEAPTEVVRAAEPLGFDPALWRKVVGLGLGAIAVPEERGGGGAGFVELAIAAEILGRTLAPAPLIEAAVATTLLASLPAGPELEPLVAGAVAGDLLPTVALHRVTGAVARVVPAGAVADVVIVLRGEDLLAVRAAEAPMTALPNLGAMPVADRPVDPATAIVVATGPEAVAAHRRAVAHWQLLTGAALVGLTGRALEIGIDYVMQRRAFGVLVANFQTVQHRLSDDATALEGARLMGHWVDWHAARSGGVPGVEGSMRKLFTTEAGQRHHSDALDILGAEGLLAPDAPGAPAGGEFEHDFRAAVVTTVYGGTSEILRDIIAQRHLGLPRNRPGR